MGDQTEPASALFNFFATQQGGDSRCRARPDHDHGAWQLFQHPSAMPLRARPKQLTRLRRVQVVSCASEGRRNAAMCGIDSILCCALTGKENCHPKRVRKRLRSQHLDCNCHSPYHSPCHCHCHYLCRCHKRAIRSQQVLSSAELILENPLQVLLVGRDVARSDTSQTADC